MRGGSFPLHQRTWSSISGPHPLGPSRASSYCHSNPHVSRCGCTEGWGLGAGALTVPPLHTLSCKITLRMRVSDFGWDPGRGGDWQVLASGVGLSEVSRITRTTSLGQRIPSAQREGWWLLSPWWVGLLGGSCCRPPVGGGRQPFSSFLVPRGGQGQRQWLWEPEGVGIPGFTGCGL